MLNRLYEGSVKDILGPFTSNKDEAVFFRFTDAYSVFDWGKMPDELPQKGAALAVMACHFFETMHEPGLWREFSRASGAFELRRGIEALGQKGLTKAAQIPVASAFNDVGEKLQKEGMPTHYLGAVAAGDGRSEQPRPQALKELDQPPSGIVVRRVGVTPPTMESVMGRTFPDYEPNRRSPAPKLIPLEVIFRFGVPKGSSLLSRVESNPDYLRTLPVPKEIAEAGKIAAGAQWGFPILELSTKLEPQDRYLSFQEAFAISGLTGAQFNQLLLKTIWLAGFLKAQFKSKGLELWDGKFEWALDESDDCVLVDSVGPDEVRLLCDGQQLSKEFLRSQYQGTPWFELVGQAKKQAKARGTLNWQRLVTEPPPPISAHAREAGSQMYMMLANHLTGKNWFSNAWDLKRVALEVEKVRGGG